MSIFEKASRAKLRFETQRGLITVEDLWQLPLKGNNVSLNSIAVSVDKQIKAAGEKSFVDDKTSVDERLELAMEIVKHVIKVRKEEIAKQQEETAKRQKREALLQQLADAEARELQKLTPEEIRKQLAELE
ncbi:hypothetical protein [Salmonella phage SSBI34]|nr:hypothetical protein [Salmonella phage SSBI34]